MKRTILSATILFLFASAASGCTDALEKLMQETGFVDLAGPQRYTKAGRPAQLPTWEEAKIYSADSPFNEKIVTGATLDPNSATMIKSMIKAAEGGFVIVHRHYSSPVYFADSATPKVDVQLTCGPYWEIGVSYLTGVPIPVFAEPSIDEDINEVIPECEGDTSQDNHMVVLDLASRCEFDLWQARKINGTWTASWANRTSLNGTGVYPKGMSTRGSGLAFLGGLIWPDELRNGRINHALGIAYPFTKASGPVTPATDTDGETKGATAIPEGARLQLDPTLDLDAIGLTGYQKTIARAMQEYGIYMVDTGSETGIGLYAIDPKSAASDPYQGLFTAEDDIEYPSLNDIPVDKLRVLKMGPIDQNFQDKLKLEDSPCASFK